MVVGSLHVPKVLPVLVGQHGWPALPHAHEPFEHVPYVDNDVWQD